MSMHACESEENHHIHILLTYVGITLLKSLEIPFVVNPVEGSGPAEHSPKAAQLNRTLVPAFDCTLSLNSGQI